MQDSTIHALTMLKQLRSADILSHNLLHDDQAKQAIISSAVSVREAGFQNINLATSVLRGKNVYRNKGLPHELVVRHMTAHIKRVTGVKQDNRDFIISCLKSILQSGERCRIYKFDIKSFYESVDMPQIIEGLRNDIAFSRQFTNAFESFFSEMEKINIPGLPRGMSISATLAEYLLRPFDQEVSRLSDVRFYARFVDDIVIVTGGIEGVADFSTQITGFLPVGLRFNSKSKHVDLQDYTKPGSKSTEAKFEFLGYKFSISHTHRNKEDKLARKVVLDIASTKICRIKTKISKALLDFKNTNDFQMFLNRIQLLTSNYNFEKKSSGAMQKTGIFFNYPMIDAELTSGLDQLDKYLRNTVCSPHPKNLLRPSLTKSQRRQILKLTFRRGFERKRFYSFAPNRLSQLTSCWSYA